MSKLICYLVGAAIAGGGVAHYAPKVAKKVSAKSYKVSPKIAPTVSAASSTSNTYDCPSPSLFSFDAPVIQSGPSFGTTSSAPPSSVILNPPTSVDAVEGVPEVGTWAMMVAGFGFVGLSARRGKKVRVYQ